MEDFIHLHVHTYYSILDGQSSIKRLVDKAIGNGMRGMAITDHGDMFGIKEFHDYVGGINKGRKKDGGIALNGKSLTVKTTSNSVSRAVSCSALSAASTVLRAAR